MDFSETEKLLLIDINNLDNVCIQQPVLFDTIGSEYVNAISMRDKAKEDLNTIDAQLSITIRKEADVNNVKLTEKKTAELVQTHLNHKEAVEKFLHYKLEADKWGVKKEAFSQRKDMIEQICRLNLSLQYSNVDTKKPRMRKMSEEEMEVEMKKQVENRRRIKLKT